jgi:3',5'-cyclic AMP phosphodiesterase CpdA
LARAQAADLVLLSGDITQRARRSQFERARRFVEAVGAPVIAVPGNHDIPLFNLAARVGWPYAAYRRAFGADLEPRWRNDEVAVVAVNTTRPWRHKHGEVSNEQVVEVARWLQAAPRNALRIVMTHHPLVVTQKDDLINRPRTALDPHEVARAWSQAGADVVISGHIHLPVFLPLSALMPGLARRTWIVQAGTVVSHRVRPGTAPSLNILRHGAGWSLERWNFDARRGEFACVAVQGIERD